MIELDLADLDLPALALHIRVDSPALGLQIQAHRVGEEKLIKLGGEAPARDWSLSSDCRSRVPRSAGDLTCALWRRGSKILRREELLLYGTPLQSPKPSPKPAPSTSLCRRRHRCHRHCRRRRLLGRSCSPRRRRRWRRWLPTLTPIQHPYTLALAPYLPLAAPSAPPSSRPESISIFYQLSPCAINRVRRGLGDGRSSWRWKIELAEIQPRRSRPLSSQPVSSRPVSSRLLSSRPLSSRPLSHLDLFVYKWLNACQLAVYFTLRYCTQCD